MLRRLRHFDLVFAGWAFLLMAREAQGTTYDRTPRPTILLKKAGKFLAQDGWDSVALFDAHTGKVLRRFPVGARVEEIDLTADEKFLLVACGDGILGLWDVRTGDNIWRKTPAQTGLHRLYDANFSRDGQFFIFCGDQDFAVIGTTATGEPVRVVRSPLDETRITFACLTPDGLRAILSVSGKVFTFDVATGMMKDTGVTGVGPFCCSTDGKFAAFRTAHEGAGESLRILTLDDKLSSRDTKQLGYIGHIRPIENGDFLVTATTREGYEYFTAGAQCHPATGELKELWKIQHGEDMRKMDFNPDTMRGVYTIYILVTSLIDLRTGTELLKIDNLANSDPVMVSTTMRGRGAVPRGEEAEPHGEASGLPDLVDGSHSSTFWLVVVAGGAVLVLVVMGTVIFLLSRRLRPDRG